MKLSQLHVRTRTQHSSLEIIFLAQLISLIMAAVCWGPPAPPSTPVSSADTLALTTALIAGYGLWKRRR